MFWRFILLCLPVCTAYQYHWKTLGIMRNNYRLSRPYDSSILDPKIDCYINNILTIRKNKTLYEKMVKKVKQVFETHKNLKLDVVKIDCHLNNFSFHWKIDIFAFQRLFHVHGCSIYDTNDVGAVLKHSIVYEKMSIAPNAKKEFYVHPKLFRPVRVEKT